MKPTVAFSVGEEGLAAAGLGIPCWGQAPGELGSAGPGAAPGRPTSPPWAALAVCGSLSLSPQARFSRSPWTFRAGRCAVTPACLLFLCRNGGVLARARGLISPGVSAFNNLGVLLLLRVARGLPRFHGVRGGAGIMLLEELQGLCPRQASLDQPGRCPAQPSAGPALCCW